MPGKVPREAELAHIHFKKYWEGWARLSSVHERGSKLDGEIERTRERLIPHVTPLLFDALRRKSQAEFRRAELGGTGRMVENLFNVASGKDDSAGSVQFVFREFLYALESGKLHEFAGLPSPRIKKEERHDALTPTELLSHLKAGSGKVISILEDAERTFGEPGAHTQGVTAADAKKALESLDAKLFSQLCERSGSWRSNPKGQKRDIAVFLNASLQTGFDPSVNPKAFPILIKAINSGELHRWLEE